MSLDKTKEEDLTTKMQNLFHFEEISILYYNTKVHVLQFY